MDTNHNRIKVADLEKNQPDRILTTNSNGEIEFSALDTIKLDSYNALDYIQEGKSLDARQGKILKDLIDSLPKFSTYPAPYLNEVIPDSYLPNYTGNIILRGSFFTPTMTVEIQGQTVNYIKFISDNEVHVNVTTGSVEGSFSVTLNNGLSVTFQNALIIILGNVYTPVESDWISVLPPLDISKGNEANIGVWNTFTSGILSKEFNYTKNFRVRFCVKKSPLGNPNDLTNEYQHAHIQFIDSTDSTLFICTVNNEFKYNYVGIYGIPKYERAADWEWGSFAIISGNTNEWWNTQSEELIIEIRHTNGVLYGFCNDVLKFRFDIILTENIRMKVDLKSFDISKIKYIETA